MLLPKGAAGGSLSATLTWDQKPLIPSEHSEDMGRTPQHQIQEELTQIDISLGLKGDSTEDGPASLGTMLDLYHSKS